MSSKIKIAIVDDDQSFCYKIKAKLEKSFSYSWYNYQLCIINKSFNNLEQYKGIKILFIDINLNSYDGIKIAHDLKIEYPDIVIIFISNYDYLVYDTFIARPFYFVRKKSFNSDMERMLTLLKDYLEHIIKILRININGREIVLAIIDILYIEAMLHKVKIVTFSKQYIYNCSFNKFLEFINNKSIVKIQRSYAINLYNIKNLKFNIIELKNSKNLTVSKIYRENFLHEYTHFCNELNNV